MRVFAVLLLLWSSSAYACSDVALIGVNVRPDVAPYMRVSGEIRNNCPDAMHVQIEIVARANGQVVWVRRRWPASTQSIPAGQTFPFSEIVDPPSVAARDITVTLGRINR